MSEADTLRLIKAFEGGTREAGERQSKLSSCGAAVLA